eukprot:365581-Chlamydomonas_euryale.AAC.4
MTRPNHRRCPIPYETSSLSRPICTYPNGQDGAPFCDSGRQGGWSSCHDCNTGPWAVILAGGDPFSCRFQTCEG